MLSVNKLNSQDVHLAAQALVEAYWDDPIFLWAMPEEDMRLKKAYFFFSYVLKKREHNSREIYITSDGAAVAVLKSRIADNHLKNETPKPFMFKGSGKESPAAAYFQWIEAYRPRWDHLYLEYVGCLKNKQNKGRGTLLVKSILAHCQALNVPLWCWSSNKRNLPFYTRLGLRIEQELTRDPLTPSVTTLSTRLVQR